VRVDVAVHHAVFVQVADRMAYLLHDGENRVEVQFVAVVVLEQVA